MIRFKTIIQPIEFVELFDAKVNDAIMAGWGVWDMNTCVTVIPHETKSDLLISRLYKDDEEN